MAQVAIPLIGMTLEEAIKALGLAGVSWGGTKIFEATYKSASGQPNADEDTKKQLSHALKELDDIKKSIHNVQTQMSSLRIETKVDQVQEHVDNVNSMYDQYTIAVGALAEASTTKAANPGLYQKCTHRCTEIGKQVIKDVYPAVVHINTSLVDRGDQSLLHLLHTQHVSESKDFLAQYGALKAALLVYLLVEARAILLLDLASKDDTVEFGPREHQETVARLWEKIMSQQAMFDSLLHQNVRNLAEHMWSHGTDRTEVTLRAQGGINIGRGLLLWQTKASMENWIVRPFIKPGYRWLLKRFDGGSSIRSSYLATESRPDPPLDGSNMNTDHFFSITADIKGPDARSLDGAGANNNPIHSWYEGTSRWKLHPAPDGRFRLEYSMGYATGTVIHCYLEAGEDGLLRCVQSANLSEPRQYFEIELWDHSKTYDPEEKSPEQHDLEGDNGYWDKPKKDDGSCVCM